MVDKVLLGDRNRTRIAKINAIIDEIGTHLNKITTPAQSVVSDVSFNGAVDVSQFAISPNTPVGTHAEGVINTNSQTLIRTQESVDTIIDALIANGIMQRYEESAFITVWDTTTANETVTLPFVYNALETAPINISIDWGDGSAIENFNNSYDPSHVYTRSGSYKVIITGTAEYYGTSADLRSQKCTDIIQYGNLGIVSWQVAFYYASLTNVTATDGISSTATNIDQMFINSDVETIDISNFDFTNVTTAESMFRNTASLESIDMSGLNLGAITSIQAMFRGSGLTSADLSGMTANSLTNVVQLFWNCTSVVTIDFSNVTAPIEDFNNMHSSNTSLTTLTLTNIDTSNATNMSNMYSYCSALTSLDLTGFDTSSVTDMSYMFRSFTGLSPDVSTFDVTSLTDASFMMFVSDFSDAHYDDTLLAWAAQTVNTGVTCHFGTAQYTEAASRATLATTNSWTITDGGAA